MTKMESVSPGKFGRVIGLAVVISLAALPLAAQDALPAIKVVPVKGCIVDDRDPARPQDPHIPPAGRFSNLKLLLGLLGKNLIWAQAGILWIPEGFPVLIDDPDPPPAGAGQRGDVLLEPDNFVRNAAARREVERVKAACNKKIGPDAKEKIVDVVIRRFVDSMGNPSLLGPMSTLKGVAEKTPMPMFLNSLPDKPMIRDPDSFRNFFRCITQGGEANESFVRTLAHENGHALSLQHPDPQDATNRLMGQTRVTSGCMLTRDEIQEAKEAADKLSGVRPKKQCGALLPEPKPRTRVAVADIGNVSQPEIDIVETIATRTADGALGLDMYLAGLVPADSPSLKYTFVVDVDNDSTTGGSPSPGFPGADLIADITVSSAAGIRSVSASVKRFKAGQFVEVTDSRIRADLVTLLEAFDVDVSAEEFPSRDAATLLVPADLLPVPLAEGFVVGAFATNLGTGETDQAPIVVGSVTEFAEPAFIKLKPLSGAPNANISVTGIGFTPNAQVDVFSGMVNVRSASTDSQGNFTTQFTAPSPTEDTFVANADGRLVSPITAVDDSFVADAMIYDPLACDINGDGKVDRNDIAAIFALRNTFAADAAYDVDCTGTITVNTARACALQCTNPGCAP
jgi:hypothetical protein